MVTHFSGKVVYYSEPLVTSWEVKERIRSILGHKSAFSQLLFPVHISRGILCMNKNVSTRIFRAKNWGDASSSWTRQTFLWHLLRLIRSSAEKVRKNLPRKKNDILSSFCSHNHPRSVPKNRDDFPYFILVKYYSVLGVEVRWYQTLSLFSRE